MAGIKNINVVSGTGNPVQMQDLQNLWDAVNILAGTKLASPSIISGFNISSETAGAPIAAGIIYFNGQAYYHTGSATVNQYLYAQVLDESSRVYENGSTSYMYQNYIVNSSASGTATGLGALIGQATAQNLEAWKASYIADGTVTTPKLADNAVTTAKVGNGAITEAKIGTGAVTSAKVGEGAITETKLADGAVTAAKMPPGAIGNLVLADGAVTTPKIANDAVTAIKVAPGAINNSKLDATLSESAYYASFYEINADVSGDGPFGTVTWHCHAGYDWISEIAVLVSSPTSCMIQIAPTQDGFSAGNNPIWIRTAQITPFAAPGQLIPTINIPKYIIQNGVDFPAVRLCIEVQGISTASSNFVNFNLSVLVPRYWVDTFTTP